MEPAETTLLAGGPSTGDESGRGSAASLKFPTSIALLPGPQPGRGHWLALADRGNHRLKFIGLEGARHGRCAQLAGTGCHGYRDGHWHTALFNEPVSVAVSSCGQVLYVADKGNHCVRAVWIGTGRPSDAAPTPNSGRGPDWENSGRLATTTPSAIVEASTGRAGADGRGAASAARFVCTLAGIAGAEGCADGAAGSAMFSSPCGVAVEPITGALLVVDKGNNRIRRIELPSANPWPAAAEGLRAAVAGSARVLAFPDAVVHTLPLVCSRTGAQWNLQRPFCLAALRDGTVVVGDHSQPPRAMCGTGAGTGGGGGGRAGSSGGSLLRLFPPPPAATAQEETSAGAGVNAVRAARRVSAATSRQETAQSVCVRRVAEGCSLGLLSLVACGPAEPLARDWRERFASASQGEAASGERCISVLVCERRQGQLVELCLPHYADMGEIRAASDSGSDSDSDSDGGHGAACGDIAVSSNSAPQPCALSVLSLPLVAAGPPLTREAGESLSLLHGKPGSQAAMSAVVASVSGETGSPVKAFLADTYRHRVLVAQLRGARTAAEQAEADAAARAGNTAPAPALLQPMARTQRVQIVGRVLATPPAHTVAGLCAAVANKSAPVSWARGALDDMRALSRGKERALLQRTSAMETTVAGGGGGRGGNFALSTRRDGTEKEGKGTRAETEHVGPHDKLSGRVSLLESASAPAIGYANGSDNGGGGGGAGGGGANGANVADEAAVETSIDMVAHADAPTWVRNATQEAVARRRIAAAAASGTGAHDRNPFGAGTASNSDQPLDSATFDDGHGMADAAGDETVAHSIGQLDESTRDPPDAAPKSTREPGASTPAVEAHSGTLPTSWTKGDVLGAGAFGTVFLCHDGNSGCFFALKEIERAALEQCDGDGLGGAGGNGAARDNLGMSLVPSRAARAIGGQQGGAAEEAEGLAELQSEISILRSLRHPNIVGYHGARICGAGDGARGSHVLQIFLEYVPGGSLRSLLSQVNPNFTTDGLGAFRRYLRGLLQGLHFLHTREPPVVHGDVKAANVLLDPTTAAVKIADFGCAVRLQRVVDANTGGGSAASAALDATAGGAHAKAQVGITGSVPWMAPEVANESGFGAAADIWSLGCTMIEMITSARPWPRYTSQVSLLLHLVTGTDTPLHASAETAEGEIEAAGGQGVVGDAPHRCIAALAPARCRVVRDLVGRCVQRDADTRWSCAQLMQHEFLAE